VSIRLILRFNSDQTKIHEGTTIAKLLRMRATTMATFVFAATVANALSGDANAAKAGEKAPPAEPTQVVLVSLETNAYEAWKSKAVQFWRTFLSDRFVGWGSSGRLDKASAEKEYAGLDCEIKSYAISDVQITRLGRDAALITHKLTIDGTCGGQKNPPASWAASVYVREGDRWKAAFHAEAAIVDPAAPSAKPAGKQATGEAKQTWSTDQRARTNDLLLREKAIWEAWKDHDAKRLAALMERNIQFINIFGIHFATKADALKDWSGKGCDVKTVDLTDAAAARFSPTAGILTFHARANGTCFGQRVGPVWGSSIYVKDGDTWKWSFGINLPARLEGG
jgi:hypothetical protein